jgi:hypothetical protein
MRLERTLHDRGYRLVDDAWESDGRRTYVHDDDASGTLAGLRQALGELGWRPHPNKLRSYQNQGAEEIEIEPGGSDTSGHFLHHMKARSSRPK